MYMYLYLYRYIDIKTEKNSRKKDEKTERYYLINSSFRDRILPCHRVLRSAKTKMFYDSLSAIST